ncbi:MAG: hypothetical protein H0V17_03995 [Deltaproteobacteria bacterium]|nr:hypothetical protein [Deltaproteobacteria bacterium]
MKRSILIALLIASTSSASGDVWKRAVEPEPVTDVYDALMQKGDDAAVAANSQSNSMATTLRQVEISAEAYRAAAKAKPRSAEPHFRIGSLLYSFFFDCDRQGGFSVPPITCGAKAKDARGRDTLEAWDTFEALAPLDPRINQLLMARAILRTKMVGTMPNPKALLEAAAKDYQALLDRDDGLLRLDQGGRVLVLGNLAETHMMLGQIEKAIDTYEVARRYGARGSTLLGLAVALDRDERGPEALRLIRELGVENFNNFQIEFESKNVFFVPEGEEHYYFALGHEAFGETVLAIEHWRLFIRSGAHPQFQPRAKERLDKLLARRNIRFEIPVPDLGNKPTPKLRK